MPALRKCLEFDNERNNLDMAENYFDYENMKTAKIIIAGQTGVGKSVLINAIFGFQDAKEYRGGYRGTTKTEKYYKSGIPICIWDTVGFELSEEERQKSFKEIKKIIIKEKPHAIWYCINSHSDRYQEKEMEFIQGLHKDSGLPFVIILTKCDDDDSDNFFHDIEEINVQHNMSDIKIIRVLAKEKKTKIGIIPSFGVDNLIRYTADSLEEFSRRGLIAAQKIRKNEMNKTIEVKRSVAKNMLLDFVKNKTSGFSNIVSNHIPIYAHKKAWNDISELLLELARVYNSSIESEELKTIWKNILDKGTLSGVYSTVNKLVKEKKFQSYKKAGYETFGMTDIVAAGIVFFGETFIQTVEDIVKQNVEEQAEKELSEHSINIEELKTKMREYADKFHGKVIAQKEEI